MGFGSWIRGKALVTILAAIALYFVGASLNLVPAPIQGFVTWMDTNTTMLLFAIISIVVCYTVLKLKRKGNQGE